MALCVPFEKFPPRKVGVGAPRMALLRNFGPIHPQTILRSWPNESTAVLKGVEVSVSNPRRANVEPFATLRIGADTKQALGRVQQRGQGRRCRVVTACVAMVQCQVRLEIAATQESGHWEAIPGASRASQPPARELAGIGACQEDSTDDVVVARICSRRGQIHAAVPVIVPHVSTGVKWRSGRTRAKLYRLGVSIQ